MDSAQDFESAPRGELVTLRLARCAQFACLFMQYGWMCKGRRYCANLLRVGWCSSLWMITWVGYGAMNSLIWRCRCRRRRSPDSAVLYTVGRVLSQHYHHIEIITEYKSVIYGNIPTLRLPDMLRHSSPTC